jgi:hypothetical protein
VADQADMDLYRVYTSKDSRIWSIHHRRHSLFVLVFPLRTVAIRNSSNSIGIR